MKKNVHKSWVSRESMIGNLGQAVYNALNILCHLLCGADPAP